MLVSLTFTMPLLQRLPVSAPTIYLAVGLALGPGALGLLSWDVVREAHLFERLTELTVLVSLFTVGLNMRRSLKDRLWLVPLRLATVTMVVTIAAVALVGWGLLDLPLGAAVLLGAMLAPTDPVLASDVQLQDASDRDELRYGLSGEAGLNDGAAFPFVVLGLGLLGLHPSSDGWWGDEPFGLAGWLLWDVAWAVAAGLAVGGATGWLVGRATLVLQRRPGLGFSLHEFLVLGLIALSYGAAELVHGYGFLSVFAAGYALRYIELRAAGHADDPAELPAMVPGGREGPPDLAEPQAAQLLAVSLIDFNDKLEHVLMASVVLLVGGVLGTSHLTLDLLWLAPLLFLVVRPLGVAIGLAGSPVGGVRRALIAWFGIRGIGSLYYLTHAIDLDLPAPLAERLTGLVLSIVVISIVVHGVSVAPLMRWYESRGAGRPSPDAG